PHELRTPLTSIRGYLELVLEGDPTPEQADYLRVIDRNADRLLDLINDLLDVAKAENGHLVLSREPVALESVLADAVAGLEPEAAARQIELGLHVATGTAWSTSTAGASARSSTTCSRTRSSSRPTAAASTCGSRRRTGTSDSTSRTQAS